MLSPIALLAAQGNHIYTSGATGTNAAVIKGALRADRPDKLTVILPQSKSKQPAESQARPADCAPAAWACSPSPALKIGECPARATMCWPGRSLRGAAALLTRWCLLAAAISQELLQQVKNVIEMPQNDELTLLEASRICNRTIINSVQQVICFAFHDSRLLAETCAEAKEMKKIVTLFYLD